MINKMLRKKNKNIEITNDKLQKITKPRKVVRAAICAIFLLSSVVASIHGISPKVAFAHNNEKMVENLGIPTKKSSIPFLKPTPSSLVVQNDESSNQTSRDSGDPQVRIAAVPNGWKVTVTWHVSSVNLPGSITLGGGGGGGAGGVGTVNVDYDAPFIYRTYFTVDNQQCGQFVQDPPPAPPGQGHYQYPNSGHQSVIMAVPKPNTPAYLHEFEQLAANTTDCGDPGPNFLQANAIIDPEVGPDAARQVIALIPLPQLLIKENPGLGVVTVPAWFWLTLQGNDVWWSGTDPAQGGQPYGVDLSISPPDPSITQQPASPLIISVRIDAAQLKWDFGDHSSASTYITNAVGKPYPQKSNIRHPYNAASTYNPQVTITYVPRYSFNGAPYTSLPDLTRQSTWQGTYTVREAQTVLVNPGGN